jgi:hypothetical protein
MTKKLNMNYKDQKLWDDIREFELDDDEAVYTFSDRLAKENKWTKGFALRAIEEYKKFMFLICTSHESRTPSDEVDKVWHLHLLYTRSYWKEFCGQVLKREVHHGPTRGGPQELDKFRNAYAETLQHYRDTFHIEPPPALWPPQHLSKRPAWKNSWPFKFLTTMI